MFLIYVLISVVAIVVIFVEYNRLKLSVKYKHIPGVTEIPIIGSKYTLRPNKIQGKKLRLRGPIKFQENQRLQTLTS